MSEDRTERARNYREAVEAYLGGPTVEAAGCFRRPQGIGNDIENLVRMLFGGFERVTKGRVGRIHGSFLLAVTKDSVHAFKYRGKGQGLLGTSPKTLDIRREIAVFGRDEIRLRTDAEGHLNLEASENGRTRKISLDGAGLEWSPGAAEVVAALRGQSDAAGLSE